MLMPLLATLISRFERQIVMDQTGLNGLFSVDLEPRFIMHTSL